MALPKSTFVMGAVVLALFGLAIRETATTSAPEHPAEVQDDPSTVGLAEREAAELARATAAEREHFDDVSAAARTAYGAEAASLGTAFAGFALGRGFEAVPEATQTTVREFETRTSSDVSFEPPRQRPVGSTHIALFDGESSEVSERLCARFDAQLHDAWGRGVRSADDTTTIWLNQHTHQRATLDVAFDRCALGFEHYVEPEDWPGTLSLELLGKTSATATKVTGAWADGSEHGIAWEVAGVGAGTELTRVIANLDDRKRVTSITGITTATEDTRSALVEHLIAKLGAPERSPITDRADAQRLTWPSHKIVLVLGEDREDRVTLAAWID